MDLMHKFSVLFVLGIFFGCISLMEPEPYAPGPGPALTCRNVTTQVPYLEEECKNVSEMKEVCKTRELDYALSQANKTYLCSEQDLCINWYQNGTCALSYCSKGMTRCLASLQNLDPQKAGEWSVAANFTLDGNTFQKNAIKKSLLPNETATFNFEQFYTMDIDQRQADCVVFVSEPAKLQDCSFITTENEVCQNVTKYKEETKEVCE